ncbi:hypothetical protein [Haloechinothrix halophila]|uniref:hypothetical protein n=1 Tax=Haloechinothrix halophila TaxID=1069073 RepID=UPI0004268ABD|nr:hypothetical protein [Haloechinothrix halophila]
MMTQRGHLTTSVTHEPTADERSRAARVVAAYARDATELTEVLDMLGLAASEAREPGSAPDQVERREHAAARARRGRTLLVSELTEMFSGSDVTTGSKAR